MRDTGHVIAFQFPFSRKKQVVVWAGQRSLLYGFERLPRRIYDANHSPRKVEPEYGDGPQVFQALKNVCCLCHTPTVSEPPYTSTAHSAG
jgi:hypothetical protein